MFDPTLDFHRFDWILLSRDFHAGLELSIVTAGNMKARVGHAVDPGHDFTVRPQPPQFRDYVRVQQKQALLR